MRTTVDLNDDLYQRAKEAAAKTKRTFTEILEDSLRQTFAQSARSAPRRRFRLVVSNQPPGLCPGVDLDNTAAMLDTMERHDAPARR